MLLSSRAAADSVKRDYNAIDLSRDLVVGTLSKGAKAPDTLVFQAGSVLPCMVRAEANDLVVTKSETCPLFAQTSPAKFTVQLRTRSPMPCPAGQATNLECVGSVTFEFSPGIETRGTFDGRTLRIPNELRSYGDVQTCVAWLGEDGWKSQDVIFDRGSLDGETLRSKEDLSRLPKQGTLTLKMGKCGQVGGVVLKILYASEQQKKDTVPFPPENSCRSYSCDGKLGPYPNANPIWFLYVDQTDLSVPRIAYNPNNYVRTNSFGRIRVRHWKAVVPTLVTSGAGASLTLPTEGGGASSERAGIVGASLLAKDGDALISEFLVIPRSPGALGLTVKFSDATDPSKARGEVSSEVLVDKSYSGAFRFGVSRVLGLDEIKYAGVQREPEGPFIVTKTADAVSEVVLGVALYADWLKNLGRGGRSYFLTSGNWFWRHAGLFAGFGAVSYSNNNVDFLKSLHLGAELEILPNFSVAITTAIRRTPKLNGLAVGDEGPDAQVTTTNVYRAGVGIVLNFSVDFLKFAAKGGQ